LHLDHPYYGSRRIAKQLAREGFDAGRLHVATPMHRMGIEALYRKPRTSIPARQAAIHPYLLSSLKIERPNQVWASDFPNSAIYACDLAIAGQVRRNTQAFRVMGILCRASARLTAQMVSKSLGLASRITTPCIFTVRDRLATRSPGSARCDLLPFRPARYLAPHVARSPFLQQPYTGPSHHSGRWSDKSKSAIRLEM
jgi:HTH-like domain